MSAFRPWVVIPVYDHEKAIGSTLKAVLQQCALPCLLVDDGSHRPCAEVLQALAAQHAPRVQVLRLESNQGKGAAMLAGFRAVAARGATHVLQIDADGQHDCADLTRFIAAAQQAPEAVINGQAVYDDSVPRARLYGRYLTHVWVWINTLSLRVKDSMCGFRVYPLAPVLELIDSEPVGRRMDFDSDILVRLVWRGLAVVNLPTRVHYPSDGVSHFDVWRDNLRISRMHARLFFGMLRRLPHLLAQRRRQ